MKTLIDFIATRQPCADLGAHLDADFFEKSPRAGFIYAGDCYIEQEPDGTFYLELYREEYTSAALADLEPILYAWCATECPEELGIPEDVAKFIINLQDAMPRGERDFAAALLANVAEPDSRICHMHDFCDANQCALDVVGDDVEKACELYNKARPVLRGKAD